jgi:DUF4097 and DUF4098 domain-containing protein YvlB
MMTPLSNVALILAVVFSPVVAQAAARDEVARTEQRTAPVPPDGAVHIDHRSGNVKVRGHQRADLLVETTFRVSANNKADAEAFLREMQLEVTTVGTTVRVRVNTPQRDGGNNDVGFAVDLDVSLPDRIRLNVENRFGNTAITGVKAPLTVSGGNGRISVTDIEGLATLKNQFGAVDVSRVTGGLDIQSSNGEVAARDVRGSATIRTAFGGLTLERISGAVSVTGTNGDIRLTGVDGETNVSSRFGRVVLRSIAGKLTANSTNGDIDAGMAPGRCHPVSLESRFGRVLVLTAGGGYALEASAKAGRIDSDVLTDRRPAPRPGDPQRIIGQIGDGRCPMALVTNNGDILIRGGAEPSPADADGYRRGAIAPSRPLTPQAPRAPRFAPVPVQ